MSQPSPVWSPRAERPSPWPVLINVQRGTVTVEADASGRCFRKRLINDTGVALRARQANRLTAGPEGADYYVVYMLPRKTGNHRPAAGAPAACAR